MCEISIIILIYRKFGLVGPVQQKIKLPLPKGKSNCYYQVWNKAKKKGKEKLEKHMKKQFAKSPIQRKET